MYLFALSLTGCMLMAAGIMDFIKKEISRGFIAAFAVVCAVGVLFNRGAVPFDIICGMSIGILALAISYLSHEQIGRGDGMIITAVGALLGARGCFVTVCCAAMIMTLVSVILLLLKKAGRHTRIPFLPALFAGYVIYLGDIIC